MLCLADFDHLPAEEMNHALELIRKDPHTLLAYTTISGTGIRVISRYFRGQNCQARSPYDLHLQAFAQINQYYAELIGHPYDEKCKNATRLSGLAHDPDVFFNPEAEAFCIESKMLPKKNEKETPNRPLKRAVRAAERQLADEGVEYIEHHHNEYIMRTGYLLNAYGIPLETATQWALKRFGDYEGDVAGIFRSCYQQTEEHGTLRLPSSSRPTDETEGKPANVAEIEEFLTTQGRFRKNTVTGRCEIATDGEKFIDLTDRHVNTLWCRYCKEKKPVRLMDMRVIIESEYSELYNPFENYFKSLPAWKNGGYEKAAKAHREKMAKHKAAVEKAKKEKKRPPSMSWSETVAPVPETPFFALRTPAIHWNGKVAPLAGYSARGFLWYQGESNAGDSRDLFVETFKILVDSWRDAWKDQSMPWISVELASYVHGKDWGAVREAQRAAAASVGNSYIASSADTGEDKDIHPADKGPISERLERIAMRRVYGAKDVADMSPEFSGAEFKKGGALVKFGPFGGKLEGRGEPRGFELKIGGKWVEAKPEIKGGSSVWAASPDGAAEPEGVRYLWKSWAKPDAWLYTSDGLPAFGFSKE